jgi:hypothetical protein
MPKDEFGSSVGAKGSVEAPGGTISGVDWNKGVLNGLADETALGSLVNGLATSGGISGTAMAGIFVPVFLGLKADTDTGGPEGSDDGGIAVTGVTAAGAWAGSRLFMLLVMRPGLKRSRKES